MLPAKASNGHLEVLNISNVDAMGQVVLNDERLLELIQHYPFLYNPRVQPYQDPDYEEWAWEQIATVFNRNYMQADGVTFSVPDLQQRWQTLRPIITSLQYAYDLEAIPETLRDIVVKIGAQLEDQAAIVPVQPRSKAQLVILENIAMVQRLPPKERRRLEAEMMELLLANDLAARATTELGAAEIQCVEREYADFMKTICLKELQPPTESTPPIIIDLEENSTSSFVASEYILAASPSMEQKDVKNVLAETNELDMSLLKPLTERPRWVPLDQAHHHTRRCMVRLKRSNLEEYLPLSKIKRERHW